MNWNVKMKRSSGVKLAAATAAILTNLVHTNKVRAVELFDNYQAVYNHYANNTNTGSGVFTSTGQPDTFIGSGFNLAGVTPGTTVITGFDIAPSNATNATNIDPTGVGVNFTSLKINVYFWGGVNSGATTTTNPQFTNLLTPSPVSVIFNNPLGAGFFFPYIVGDHANIPGLVFSSPVVLPSSTIGMTVEIQGATATNPTYQDYPGLTTSVEGGIIAPLVGSDTNEGWHRNANSETNGNFTSALRTSVGSGTTDGVATDFDKYESVGTDLYGGNPTTYKWASATDGVYTDTSKWTPTGSPGSVDTAVFNLGSGSTYTVEIGDQEYAYKLNVLNDNVALNFDGQQSNLYVSKAMTIGQSQTSGGTFHGNLTLENTSDIFTGIMEPNALIVGGNGGVGTVTVTNGVYLFSDNDTAINAGSKLVVGQFAKFATDTLTIAGATNAWTGQLDIGTSFLNIRDGNLATVMNQLKTGLNNGTWTGQGIVSSAAAADTTHLTAVGVILNNDGNGNQIYGNTSTGTLATSFDGDNPSITSVLIRYTYFGDANLDGKVDGSDYSRIDSGFLNHATGWYNGDFNYDGVVNGSDYTLIDNVYNQQGSPIGGSSISPGLLGSQGVTASDVTAFNLEHDKSGVAVPIPVLADPSATITTEVAGASVPEPASAGILVSIAGAALLRRRRARA